MTAHIGESEPPRRIGARFGAFFLAIASVLVWGSPGIALATPYSWNVGSGDWFTPTNWSPTGVPGIGDNVTISNGGTCTLDSPASIANLTLSNGTLAGSATLDVGGPLSWTAGTMSGTGVTNANGGLAFNGGFTRTLGRTLNVNAAATWSGTGSIGLTGSVLTLNIAAGTTFDVQGDSSIVRLAGLPTIANAGTFQKSAGSGTAIGDNGITFTKPRSAASPSARNTTDSRRAALRPSAARSASA